jgi:hypothetical protein
VAIFICDRHFRNKNQGMVLFYYTDINHVRHTTDIVVKCGFGVGKVFFRLVSATALISFFLKNKKSSFLRNRVGHAKRFPKGEK